MLKLQHLHTGFNIRKGKKITLASGLNFSAVPGELTAIIGPNGVGKSTLLRTIMRLHPVLDGTIEINDQDISSYSPADYARISSFVPAGRISLPGLSVEEVVSLARYPHTGWFGKLTEQDHAAITRAIEALHLQPLRHRQLSNLSDGEQQRVWIARALAQSTPVVIMDEPTAFLDVPNRFEIYRFLKEAAVIQNRLFLFASHDLDFVLGMTDKIWLLLHGESHEGAPEDLLSSHVLEKLFSHSGITYHPEQGLLLPVSAPHTYIHISGDIECTRWLTKALTRAGFGVSKTRQPGISLTVRCEGKDIFLKKNGRKIQFSTVYALILFLKRETQNRKSYAKDH